LLDIIDSFKEYGTINKSFVVKKDKAIPGAEIATCFLEYNHTIEAERAVSGMGGKRFDGRDIRINYVNESQYKKDYLPLA